MEDILKTILADFRALVVLLGAFLLLLSAGVKFNVRGKLIALRRTRWVYVTGAVAVGLIVAGLLPSFAPLMFKKGPVTRFNLAGSWNLVLVKGSDRSSRNGKAVFCQQKGSPVVTGRMYIESRSGPAPTMNTFGVAGLIDSDGRLRLFYEVPGRDRGVYDGVVQDHRPETVYVNYFDLYTFDTNQDSTGIITFTRGADTREAAEICDDP